MSEYNDFKDDDDRYFYETYEGKDYYSDYSVRSRKRISGSAVVFMTFMLFLSIASGSFFWALLIAMFLGLYIIAGMSGK